MNENSVETKVVTEAAEQNIGTGSTVAKNKKKLIILCAAILVYSLILVGVTVKVDRVVIAKQFEKSWQDAFSEFEDSFDDDDDFFGISDNTGTEESEPEVEAKPISLNKTVTIGDVMELTLESSEWTDEIIPSNTSGVYSYKSDVEGEKFFVVRGKVKNIAGETMDITYVNESQLLINDTYKANVNIEAEESDGTSFYGDVKPLQTLNIVVYASVSDELFDIADNVKLTLNMLSDSSKIGYFYDNEYPHETYTIEFKN